MRALFAVLSTFILFASVAVVPAAAESGVARGVTPQASAFLGGKPRDLVVGSDVQIGETIKTDAKGLVQLIFRDNSKLVVGPNSELLLEDYLIRNNNSAGKFAINTLSGTFRFITGTAPKDQYQIKTPTGTIGVRGTGLEWTVIRDALPDLLPPASISTIVLLLHGGIQFCNLAGDCETLFDVCDFGAFNSGGTVGLDNTREVRDALRGYFPLADNQSLMLFQFWITGARECLNPPPPSAGGGAPLVGGSGVPPQEEEQITTTVLPTTTTTSVSTTMYY